MTKLIAKGRFYYAGRNVEADEEFEAEEQDVAILTDSVSPRARKPPPEVRKASIEAAPPVAAASPSPAATLSQPQVDHPKEPVRRRQYLRRDMRAED